MSSAYHLQIDRMTKRVNYIIEQMLYVCIALRQHDWVSQLPVIECTINLARSETTSFSLFFLSSGHRPGPMI
jgi:hypothetical protein